MIKTFYALLLAAPLASACTVPTSETVSLLNQENDGGRSSPENPYQPYIDLATCLTSKEVDARMYSVSWCDACQFQKVFFSKEGWEVMERNEVVCSTDYQKPFSEECVEAGIEAYPAWKFKTHDQLIYGIVQVFYDPVEEKYINDFERYTPCKIE